MNNQNPDPKVPSFPVLLDEFGHFAHQEHDQLREHLRTVDGVPNATYAVESTGVFVFEKLVQLVAQFSDRFDPDASESNATLIELRHEAVVSPQVAIEDWKIVPWPYTIRHTHDGMQLAIDQLNAVVPRRFHTQEELSTALESALLGRPIPVDETKDFEFRGQPLKLLASFDLSQLPSRPSWLRPISQTPRALFVPDFPPLPADVHRHILGLAASARDSIDFLRRDVCANASFWPLAEQVPPADLPHVDNETSGNEGEIAALSSLRLAFPELSAFGDAALFNHYSNYRTDGRYRYCDELNPSRSPEFVAHLFGRLCSLGTDDAESNIEAGFVVAHSLLSGSRLPRAIADGAQWHDYQRAISEVAGRASRAMWFLQTAADTLPLTGGRITTMHDLMRWGRSAAPSDHTPVTSSADFTQP